MLTRGRFEASVFKKLLKKYLVQLQVLELIIYKQKHEYEQVSKIGQLQKTFRLPHEWPFNAVPKEIHCIN